MTICFSTYLGLVNQLYCYIHTYIYISSSHLSLWPRVKVKQLLVDSASVIKQWTTRIIVGYICEILRSKSVNQSFEMEEQQETSSTIQRGAAVDKQKKKEEHGSGAIAKAEADLKLSQEVDNKRRPFIAAALLGENVDALNAEMAQLNKNSEKWQQVKRMLSRVLIRKAHCALDSHHIALVPSAITDLMDSLELNGVHNAGEHGQMLEQQQISEMRIDEQVDAVNALYLLSRAHLTIGDTHRAFRCARMSQLIQEYFTQKCPVTYEDFKYREEALLDQVKTRRLITRLQASEISASSLNIAEIALPDRVLAVIRGDIRCSFVNSGYFKDRIELFRKQIPVLEYGKFRERKGYLQITTDVRDMFDDVSCRWNEIRWRDNNGAWKVEKFQMKSFFFVMLHSILGTCQCNEKLGPVSPRFAYTPPRFNDAGESFFDSSLFWTTLLFWKYFGTTGVRLWDEILLNWRYQPRQSRTSCLHELSEERTTSSSTSSDRASDEK